MVDRSKPQDSGHPERVATLRPGARRFTLVFLSMLMVTVLCLASQVLLAALWPEPTQNQQGVSDALGFAWKTGLGSIVGLLGGRVT